MKTTNDQKRNRTIECTERITKRNEITDCFFCRVHTIIINTNASLLWVFALSLSLCRPFRLRWFGFCGMSNEPKVEMGKTNRWVSVVVCVCSVCVSRVQYARMSVPCPCSACYSCSRFILIHLLSYSHSSFSLALIWSHIGLREPDTAHTHEHECSVKPRREKRFQFDFALSLYVRWKCLPLLFISICCLFLAACCTQYFLVLEARNCFLSSSTSWRMHKQQRDADENKSWFSS